jgi:hypothetical protein
VAKVLGVRVKNFVAEGAEQQPAPSGRIGREFIGREWHHSMPRWDPPFWIGDRLFTARDLELIRWTVRRFPGLSRRELASTICENLPCAVTSRPIRAGEIPAAEGLVSHGEASLAPATREGAGEA